MKSNLLFNMLFFCCLTANTQHYGDIKRGDVIECEQIPADGAKVVFIATPENCYTCMEGIISWSRYLESIGNTPYFILSGGSEKLGDKIINQYDLNVTLIGDPNGELTTKFKISNPPVMILIGENNKVIDFEKVGGGSITKEVVKATLPQPNGFMLVKEIKPMDHNEEYILGSVRDLQLLGDNYILIDKTFRNIILMNQDGEVINEFKNSQDIFTQLLRLFPIDETHFLAYDVPTLGSPTYHLIEVKADSMYVKNQYVVENTDEYQVSYDFIFRNNKFYIPVLPTPNSWSSYDEKPKMEFLASFKFNEEKNNNNFKLSGHSANTFLPCLEKLDEFMRMPNTIPILFPVDDSTIGMFFMGNNVISLYSTDDNLKLKGQLTLKLDDFKPSICTPVESSILINVDYYDGAYIALYKKQFYLTDGTFEQNFHMQVLDKDGNPLGKAWEIPKEASHGRRPMYKLVDKNKAMFATKKEGENYFSLYEFKFD